VSVLALRQARHVYLSKNPRVLRHPVTSAMTWATIKSTMRVTLFYGFVLSLRTGVQYGRYVPSWGFALSASFLFPWSLLLFISIRL